MNKYILLVFIVVFCSACKKHKYSQTSAKGRITLRHNSQPISNLKINIIEGNLGGAGFFNPPPKGIIKTVYTDANGYYDFGEFDTRKKDGYYYNLDFTDNNNLKFSISNDHISDELNLTRGENNMRNFIFAGETGVIDLYFAPPPNNEDSIITELKFISFEPSQKVIWYINNRQVADNGRAKRLTNILAGKYSFKGYKIKNGITTQINDTLEFTWNQEGNVYIDF